MILPERLFQEPMLFQEPIENRINKMYNPKSVKQIVRDDIKIGDQQLKKALAKKMLNPY